MIASIDEWIGGLVTLPSIVTGEGEPYQPEALVWVDGSTGQIVGTDLGPPGESLANAAALLAGTIAHPMAGPPRTPRRVRVASRELADALRGAVGDVDVVCAPTPEIDEVLDAMRAHFEGAPKTHLGTRVTPADMARLFSALARLYRAQPWATLPPDALLAITSPAIGVEDGVLCVVGQLGTAYGFSLFRRLADWEGYVDLIDARATGLDRSIPTHTMVTFDPRFELSRGELAEIETHRWEIAGPAAYPRIAIVGDAGRRTANRDEVIATTAIVNAVVELLRDATLASAWVDGRPREATAEDPLRVTVTTMLTEDDAIHGGFVDPEGKVDVDALEEYREAIIARFVRSPAGRGFDGSGADLLVEWAARGCLASVLELRPHELFEILFKVIPERVAIQAPAAAAIMAEVRAFLAFVADELGSDFAARCYEAIPANAVQRLEQALDDPTNFSPAKTFVIEGIKAGHDMTTREGITAFMNAQANRPAAKAAKPEKKAAKPAKKPPAKKPTARRK